MWVLRVSKIPQTIYPTPLRCAHWYSSALLVITTYCIVLPHPYSDLTVRSWVVNSALNCCHTAGLAIHSLKF